MYSLVLAAKDIPDNTMVRKAPNAFNRYILKRDIKVYTPKGYDVEKQEHIQNKISLPDLCFLIGDDGDITGIDINKEMTVDFDNIVKLQYFVEKLKERLEEEFNE
jgi:hypothetical protein